MLIYYIIYIPFILSSFLDRKRICKKSKQRICLLWVWILTFFWGLRWKCGTDWQQFHDTYYSSFYNNIFSFDRGINEPLEPGYVFINAIFNELNLPYTVFLLFFSFTMLLCWAKFCLRYFSYPIIGFIYIIITLGIFFPTRQAFAMSLLSLGFKYLGNKSITSFLKYTFIILITSLIHASALFGLFIYIIPHIKLSSITSIGIMICSFIIGDILPAIMEKILSIFTFMGPLVTIRLESYSQITSSISDDFSSRGTMSFLLSFTFLILFLWKKYNNSNNINLRYSFNGYIIMETIRTIFSYTMRDLMRLELYLHPFSSLIISEIVGTFEQTKKQFILSRLFFTILMAYFLTKMLWGFFSDLYVPYNCILFL